jgi:large subunit ribosomal protein L35
LKNPADPFINTPSRIARLKGCRGGSIRSTEQIQPHELAVAVPRRPTESQMPKLKTKSGAKKRFKISATGKVIAPQANKRHGMIKRTKKQIRQLRGTTTMKEVDARHVRKIYMPYG